MLPSQTNRFGMSWVRPNLSTTDVEGSLPIRAPPTRCAKRDSCTTCFAPEADRRTHRIKGVKAVDNEIEVTGPEISDQQLEDKLGRAIAYDRVGYGTTPFNASSVNVQDGVATLGGTAYGPG